MKIQINKNLDLEELTKLLTDAYNNLHPDDSARFTSKQQQSLGDWFDISRLEAYVKSGDGFLLEAREKGELAGVAFVGKQNILSWPDGNKMELFLLAVYPKYRGKGIGQALIVEAEKIAKVNGAKKMLIHTHVNMEADQRLYRDKMGYTSMGVLSDYYGNGDATFFIKNL